MLAAAIWQSGPPVNPGHFLDGSVENGSQQPVIVLGDSRASLQQAKAHSPCLQQMPSVLAVPPEVWQLRGSEQTTPPGQPCPTHAPSINADPSGQRQRQRPLA